MDELECKLHARPKCGDAVSLRPRSAKVNPPGRVGQADSHRGPGPVYSIRFPADGLSVEVSMRMKRILTSLVFLAGLSAGS